MKNVDKNARDNAMSNAKKDLNTMTASNLSDIAGMTLALWDGDREQRKRWLLAREKEGRLAESVGRILTEFLAEHVQGETGGLNRYLHGDNEKAMSNVLELLRIIRVDLMTYKVSRVTEFLAWGTIAVPMLPVGLEFLRVVKDFSADIMRGATDGFVDKESKLGRILLAIREGSQGSGVMSGRWTNMTSTNDGKGTGTVRIGLDLDPGTVKALPNGLEKPPALLARSIVGVEIENLEDLRTGADMCMSGTIEFLNRFGISFDGGAHDCQECGHETDYDCEEIEYCETFTLTAPMVDAIEEAGFLEKVSEHLECDGAGADWTEFLAEHDTAEERLSALTPSAKYLAKDAIKYNPKEWNFIPDYAGLESIDDLCGEDLLELIPVLVEVARIYEGASALPPIPGKLERAEGTCSYRRPGDGSLAWDPEKARLTHKLSTIGAALVFSPFIEGGSPELVTPRDETKSYRRVMLTHCGNVWTFDELPQEAGPLAVRYLPITQGRAEI